MKNSFKAVFIILLIMLYTNQADASNYYYSGAYNMVHYYDTHMGDPEDFDFNCGTKTSITSSSTVPVRACFKSNSTNGWWYGPYYIGSISTVEHYICTPSDYHSHRHGVQTQGSSIANIQ